MRNPAKTAVSLSVQRRVDAINEALYAQTNDASVQVVLGAGLDTMWIFYMVDGYAIDAKEVHKVNDLYAELDLIHYFARYYSEEHAWWEWA